MEEFMKKGILKMLFTERLKFEKKLEDTRRNFRKEIQSGDRSATKSHIADCCLSSSVNNGYRSANLGKVLRKFDLAIQRTYAGTYGTCTSCGNQIPISRLQEIPFTENCIHCKRLLEKEQNSHPISINERPGAYFRPANTKLRQIFSV